MDWLKTAIAGFNYNSFSNLIVGLMKVRLISISVVLSGFLVGAMQPADAQGFLKGRTEDLPKVQFYMARQQWQYVDDSPLINGQPGTPGQPQPGQSAPGANNGRPMPLPRSGFQSYSPSQPAFNTSLPKVVNGVPPKDVEAPAAPKGGKKAKTGKLGPASGGAPATAKTPKAPTTTAKSYSPYKGYNPQQPSQMQATSANAGSNMQSNTRVRGVLHWARGSR